MGRVCDVQRNRPVAEQFGRISRTVQKLVDRERRRVACTVVGEPQTGHGETWDEILQRQDRGVQTMAKKEKRTRYLIVKVTDAEFEKLDKVAGHYKKSEFIRDAIAEKIEKESATD